MRILLVRPPAASFISHLKLVQVEPLELEILLAAVTKMGHLAEIHDAMTNKKNFRSILKEFKPDVVAITGYITQKSFMINYAKITKAYHHQIQVLIGGVHAEINYRDFFHPAVDLIVHSGGVRPFQEVLKLISENMLEQIPQIPGICYHQHDHEWSCNKKIPLNPDETPNPDRSFFYRHQHHFNYLYFRPCALVKTSYSCPHHCNFCYCCLLNQGRYLCRDLNSVIEEISSIECENIWLVDDTFYQDLPRLKAFIRMIRERQIKKNFILYYRADFVSANEELIVRLKEIGLKMVIIGLEAFDDQALAGYDKNTSAAVNEKCLAILKKHDIDCTGLFVLDIDSAKEDFVQLFRYIKKHSLNLSTVSILTPLPGTGQHEKYQHRLTAYHPKQWDFLHLVAKPGKMTKGRFYFEFYRLNLKILIMNIKSGTWKKYLRGRLN